MVTLDHPETLADVEAACWAELGAAVAHRSHAWHAGVLATIEGDRADARMVVMREIDVDRRVVRFFSDSRAGKIRQLQDHPQGTLVFWCPTRCWQLRAAVTLEAETDGLAVTSRWAQVKLRSAKLDYLSHLPPGTPLAGADEPSRMAGGLGHFAVVSAQVTSLDWLELNPTGHRRARFGPDGAVWLQA